MNHLPVPTDPLKHSCPARPKLHGGLARLLCTHSVQTPRDGGVVVDDHLEIGHVPPKGTWHRLETASTDLANGIDARVLQRRDMLVGHGILVDLCHQRIKVPGGIVKTIPRIRAESRVQLWSALQS